MLRPGPPPSKGGRWDLVAGAVGVVLLIVSAYLAVALPEEEVLPPQFKVDFPESTGHIDPNPKEVEFNRTRYIHDFFFNVTEDNVFSIELSVHFADGLAASDPDTFTVELYDPNQNPMGPPEILTNDPPVRNATNPSRYDPLLKTATIRYPVGSLPEATVVEADLNATEESVTAAQERLNHFSTKGLWKVHVALTLFGDCPSAVAGGPSSDTTVRAAACVQANGGNTKDPGNLFTVGSFSYSRFTANAERL